MRDTYIHPYVLTYIHNTYIHTYKHTHCDAHTHTHIRTYIHAYIHPPAAVSLYLWVKIQMSGRHSTKVYGCWTETDSPIRRRRRRVDAVDRLEQVDESSTQLEEGQVDKRFDFERERLMSQSGAARSVADIAAEAKRRKLTPDGNSVVPQTQPQKFVQSPVASASMPDSASPLSPAPQGSPAKPLGVPMTPASWGGSMGTSEPTTSATSALPVAPGAQRGDALSAAMEAAEAAERAKVEKGNKLGKDVKKEKKDKAVKPITAAVRKEVQQSCEEITTAFFELRTAEEIPDLIADMDKAFAFMNRTVDKICPVVST